MIDGDLVTQLRRSFGAALDHDKPAKARRELVAAGWLDALAHDEPTAVAVVFRLQGATRHDAAALDDVIVGHLAASVREAPGDVAIAYPVSEAPSDAVTPSHVALSAHRDARRLLWVPDLGGGNLQVIELDTEISDRPVAGIDPDFGLVGLSGPPSGRSTRLAGRDTAAWSEALTAGRVALAHQLTAGARTLLDMATAYATSREQFDQPIAAFQAIKHRLAETLVAISSADAATVAAASTQRPAASAVAKALAGRAASAAAKNCLQVFGGIGFTTEHDFHRYFRRNLVLDRLLGHHRAIERELGKQLRRGRLEGERIVELDDAPRVDLLAIPTGGNP